MDAELSIRIQKQSGISLLGGQQIAGGDAAQAWKVELDSGKAGFLKTVAQGRPFRMEALGLERLRCENGMRVPEVLAVGDDYLLLEWIEFSNPAGDFQTRLGEALARTHLCCRGETYGFDEDHYIGVTPQKNLPQVQLSPGAWAAFWWSHRLEPMFRRLGDAELLRQNERLSEKIVTLLSDPEGPPSLLHGDLWSGNVSADTDGRPVMFDPAPSYGHPEAELGMTRMFGGFTDAFYDAYQQNFPLQSGWRERLDLYMLYHVVNHAVIFGGGYLRQARKILGNYI